MDGYTVDEAAEVLGIPGERVWELITTGVLAASSEGRSGMRVFLQPRTSTDVASVAGGEPRGSEATPFRELLTEFRNLTERYGQALLALGEARGEVASLRGRVELLEARIDVRHAPARIAPVGSWPSAETLVHDEDEASLDEIAGQAPPAAEQEIAREEVSAEEVLAEATPAGQEAAIDQVSAEGTPAGPEAGTDQVSAEEAPGLGQFLEPEVDAEVQAPLDGGLPDEAVTASEPEETDGRARRRGRSRAGHSNLADIPAALARAEDPSAAELRSARAEEAAAAEPDEVAPQAVADPDEVAAQGAAAQPDEPLGDLADRADVGAPASEDFGSVLEEEALETDTPPYELGSPYTTAFDEPDWIVEDDLWRSVAQAGGPDAGSDSLPATDRLPFAEPASDEPSVETVAELDRAAEPAEAETDGWASVEPASQEVEASVSIEPAGEEPEALVSVEPASQEAEASGSVEPEEEEAGEGPETSASPTAAHGEAPTVSGADGQQPPPAIEEISADVAFSIAKPEPDEQQVDEAQAEGAEPPGDFEAFMAAADLGWQSGTEPDYSAELEHSTAGWHSASVPGEQAIEAHDAEPPPDTEEAAGQPDQSATATADQPTDSTTDSWDASEMEAIRALLARANAIDREQLEVEASSHPLEPEQEESVREIVASGVVDEPAVPERSDGEELLAEQLTPDGGHDEPPLSLAPQLELPGSNDLGEAMAALEAIASEDASERPEPDRSANARSSPLWPEAERRVWSGATAEPWTTPVPTLEVEPTIEPDPASSPGEEVLAHLDFGAPPSYDPSPMTQDRSHPTDAPSDEDAEWSESHEGAAGRAFRRLRRIFPG